MSFKCNLAHFGESILKNWLYAFVAILLNRPIQLSVCGLGVVNY